jgi:hypothetical protein
MRRIIAIVAALPVALAAACGGDAPPPPVEDAGSTAPDAGAEAAAVPPDASSGDVVAPTGPKCGAQGACASGQTCCDGTCVDTQTDLGNCGACGKPCQERGNAARTCVAGACVFASCKPSFLNCNNIADDGCEVESAVDPKNCGACDNKCVVTAPNTESRCVTGACTAVGCQTGFADCDKAPANGCEISTATDKDNCGACGKSCVLSRATSVCSTGSCVIEKCDTNYGDCNKNSADGCEVALQSDAKNCGTCGTVCPAGTPQCIGGVCKATCQNNPKWTPVDCTTTSYVWSRDRSQATTLADANAKRLLATVYGAKCSLSGTGWVSTSTFQMQNCSALWYHIGGTYTGNCGGHDGSSWRHLVLGDTECYDY